MGGRHVIAARTFLEMRDPSALRHAPLPDATWRVERMLDCPATFWRFLYSEIGREHRWVDRLPWSPSEIRAYLADPAVSIWLFTVWGAPAGYFELRRCGDGSTEIVYFGLLEEFHGRGLGGHLLTQAVQRAWETGANRIWLHTNTQDHAAALPNYLRRGFTVYKTESFLIDV